MTEKDYEKITDLYKKLEDEKQKESQLRSVMEYNNIFLFNSLSGGVQQFNLELEGKALPLERIVDKVFFENQNRISKVIKDILREELDNVEKRKNELKMQFKNIKVVGCGEEKGNNEN